VLCLLYVIVVFIGRASGIERRICREHYRATAGTLSFEFDDFYQKTDVTRLANAQFKGQAQWQTAVCGIAK
jgi:hypothetical protein